MPVEDVAVAGMFEGEDEVGYGIAGHEIEDIIAEVELEERLKSLEPVSYSEDTHTHPLLSFSPASSHTPPVVALLDDWNHLTSFRCHASCRGVA